MIFVYIKHFCFISNIMFYGLSTTGNLCRLCQIRDCDRLSSVVGVVLAGTVQLVSQGPDADAEELGRLGAVVVGGGEGVLDEDPFGVGDVQRGQRNGAVPPLIGGGGGLAHGRSR